MSDGSFELFVFATLGVTIALGVPLGSAWLANKSIEQAKQDYESYRYIQKQLRHLRYELGKESWRWPIYVRPVLFTEIDQVAQVHFSNAQSALCKAEEMEQYIQKPPAPPPIPIQRFSIPLNWRNINFCQALFKDVAHYQELKLFLENELQNLRTEHAKEKDICRKVTEAVDTLEQRVQDSGEQSKSISGNNAFEQLLYEALSYVQNSLLMAREYQTNETDDRLNYAIIDILTRFSNYILDHLDLYHKGVQIPARFYADHFETRLKDFRKHLDRIREVNTVTDWKSLFCADCMLLHGQRKERRARESLLSFLGQQREFLALENQLYSLDLSEITQNAEALEKSCEEYWMTYEEGIEIWQGALGRHPIPTLQISNSKRLLQANIIPSIITGKVIKQTELPQINENIQTFLSQIETAKKDANSLINLLEVHKKAQVEVEQQIVPGGVVHERVKALEPIRDDTSRELQKVCIYCIQRFDVYVDKASKVRGANFPAIQHELPAFIKKCEQAKKDHETLVNDLSVQSRNLQARLKRNQYELAILEQERPLIDWDWEDTRRRLSNSINEYDITTRSYTKLNKYISKARQAVDTSTRDRDQIREKRKQFQTIYQQAGKTLTELKIALQEVEDNYRGGFSWAYIKITEDLRPVYKAYNSHYQAWLQTKSLETVQQALAVCEQVEKEAKELLSINLNLIIRPIAEKCHQQKVNRDNILESVRGASVFGKIPTGKVPTRNIGLINQLCELSLHEKDPASVDWHLEMARSLLTATYTHEEIDELRTQITIGSINASGQSNVNVAGQINQGYATN